MAYNTYIYYGNGECYLESEEGVTGIQIDYRGRNIEIENKVKDEIIFFHRNNKILFASLKNKPLPSELFVYSGSMKLINSLATSSDLQPIYPLIKQQMDYTELFNSNTETMDRLTEDIGVTIKHSKQKVNPTTTIDNLNTKTINEVLRYEDGSEYEGDFHIHIATNQIMSGATHTKESINLTRYYSPDFLNKQAKRQKKRKENRDKNRELIK